MDSDEPEDLLELLAKGLLEQALTDLTLPVEIVGGKFDGFFVAQVPMSVSLLFLDSVEYRRMSSNRFILNRVG